MTFDGIVRNGTIVLDQGATLPEGTRVKVDVYLAEEADDSEEQAWAMLGRPGWRKNGTILRTQSTTTGRDSMEFKAGDVVLVPFPTATAWPRREAGKQCEAENPRIARIGRRRIKYRKG